MLAACVGARSPGADVARAFETIDRNSDDVIEQPEFVAAFDRFDLDGDGVIVADENAAIVYEVDGDRDGAVTLAEFRTIDLARLEADADLDGRISRAELERFMREHDRDMRQRPRTARGVGELTPEARWLQFRF